MIHARAGFDLGNGSLDAMKAPMSPQTTQIERLPLHEVVAGRVRDLIIEGELAPGDEVGEAMLCELLGVSRTPIREAIRTLAGEGLIVLRPGRSTIVRQFTRQEVRGMLDVLAELEAMAARQICADASDAQIKVIAEVHDRMMRHFAAGERLPYYKLNQRVHSMVVEATGNEALVEVHELLQARMKRIRYVGNGTPDKWASAAGEHAAMIEALSVRDAETAATAMRTHIQNTWLRIKDDIAEAG